MQTAYRYKLKPEPVQGHSMQSWLNMLRSMRNYALADRVDSYTQSFIAGDYCDLHSKGEACPLTCSVVRSASLGNPWKEDKPNLRRGKIKGDYCDIKTKEEKSAFNPRRSAYEMQSSSLPTLKQQRPWYKAVNFDVMQQCLQHLNKAFTNFFEGRANFPQFKSKSEFKSFEFKPGSVQIDGNRIYLPTLGWMKFYNSRPIPDGFEIRTATVTREADGWYVSILIRNKQVPDALLKSVDELKTVNGVDRGIKKITAESDGTVTPNPQIGKKNQRRLEIRQRALSRKKKGSNNRKKAANKVAKLHQTTKRRRDDFQWKLAKRIAQSADVIGFEDLNIQGMKKRCKPKLNAETGKYERNGQSAKSALNKAISDAAWYNLYLKVKCQAAKLGNWVVKVAAHGSSQECSECGYTSPNNRDKEKFVCEECGHHEDADVDAAIVIAKRTVKKLGIDSLLLVRQKVMPTPEVTGDRKKEISLPLGGEPGNQTRRKKEKQQVVTPNAVQLSLFAYLPGESTSILRSNWA